MLRARLEPASRWLPPRVAAVAYGIVLASLILQGAVIRPAVQVLKLDGGG